MNKHQYSAIATAIFGLTASAVLWTKVITVVKLPSVPDVAISVVEELLGNLFTAHKQEVSSNAIGNKKEIQHLGVHFAKTIVSPIPPTSQTSPTPLPTPLHASAVQPSELDNWELARAWSIDVPSLRIRAPILLPSMRYWNSQEWTMLEEQMQVGLNHGAVAYPHSASPGSVGSLIVAGHSSPPDEKSKASAYGHLFASLPDIEIGQDIVVRSGRDTITYRIDTKEVVSPQHTEILRQQNDESILRVITCYPVGTTRNRMIITARKIE